MSKSDSFYSLETLGGILLFIAAMLALLVANSPYRGAYDYFLQMNGSVGVGQFLIKKPLILWINDGLMAIYFMLLIITAMGPLGHHSKGTTRSSPNGTTRSSL